MEHFVEWCQSKSKEFEFLVILRPTSPFREPQIIKKAMSLIETLGQSVSSLRAAHVAPESPYKWFKRDNLGFFSFFGWNYVGIRGKHAPAGF